MGTSTTGTLTAAEMQDVAQARDAMSAVGSGTTTTAKFNYFAAFDGTNNDRNNVPAGQYKTNVANLVDQVVAATPTNQIVELGYFKGVGTGGDEGGFLEAGILPTKIIATTATKAYDNFQQNVRDYYEKLTNKDDFRPDDITASIACFSRGCPTGLEFAWMINDRGITKADGTILAPPGSIKISGGFAMMDPVNRFVDGSRGIPPNVTSPVLVAYATDETRTDFRPMDFSNDPRVNAVWMRGNHCGIGGGYDLNGTAAAVLEGMTDYFQNLGTALDAVPDSLKFNPNTPATIYTEEYQTANGQVLQDIETGASKRVWRVDSGPRKMITTPAPSATNPLTSSYFQDRYEEEDITQAMKRVANLTEADIREIAAYEGLAPLMAGVTLDLDFSSFGSAVNSENYYTISVPSLANMVRAGMTVQEAVTSTLTSQFGTSLMASGFFGQGAEFDATSFTNAIDSGDLSGFMDGLSQLEARSYLAQYFIKDSLDLDIPIFNSEGEDLTARLNELIPGTVESIIDSADGAMEAFARELRTSMDVDKSGLMLNGSRDPDSPYRPQVTGEFMYLPQEILRGMEAYLDTDFFPNSWELMQDVDYPDMGWNQTMGYRVFVDGVCVDQGAAFCLERPSMHGSYHVGDNPINRLTVFVNGELYFDDYFDLSQTPYSYIGPSAVYSYNVQPGEHMYGEFWKVEPRYYYSQSSSSSFEALVDADEGMAAPSLTQSSASQLAQAMSQMGSSGSVPSFSVMRQDEPLLLAAN